METILITGAGGFLGAAAVKAIAGSGKYRIVASTSGRKTRHFPEGVSVESADLMKDGADLIKRVRPDIILHLAWGQQDGPARNACTNIEWLEASYKLLRAFIDSGGRRFVFAGTSSEYEDLDGLRREIPVKIQMSMYGETKKAFSDVAKNYCRRVGVEFADVRLFTLYGEGDPHEFGAIPMCIRTLMDNKQFICKAPNTVRDYVYIQDAARAVEAVITSNYCGSINVSSGQPRSMREVFGYIAGLLGKQDLLRMENEDGCELILVGDNSTLLNVIGFDGFTRFEEGMRRTVSWWIGR